MPIRLLHIIPTLDRGGAEKQLALLAAGLPRDEFDVHVCCLTRSGPWEAELQSANVPVHVIGKRRKVDPAAHLRLKRFIRELRPDIVHTWLFAANAYGRKAALSAGVKHIVAGERCVDRWKRWPHFAVDRWLARRTEKIITNSAGVRDFYAAHGIAAEKFAVIANGGPIPLLPGDDERERLRISIVEELNLPRETKLIAAVGRLWPQKNYKHLMWAMCLLKEIRRDFHLLVFGEGPHRWRLERYGRQVQILGEHVTLLGERDDVPRLLPAMRCFVNASAYEGQSNSLMEAMAAGLPVVATDIPGNRDLVVPDETGYLVAPGDRADLARWVNVLLDDDERAARFGNAGRQRMRDHFSVEQMVARHVDLYRRLLRGG